MKSTLMAFAALLALGTTSCHRSSPEESAAKFLQRGKHSMSRKDYARAELEFKNAARLLPNDAESQYELGLAYLGEGNLNLAVAALFRATKLDPKHAGARTKVAELLAQSGDQGMVKEGEKWMRELLQSTPANTDALNVLALSELELGEFQDAESHLRGALQRLPNNVSSKKVFALLHLRLHDYEDAEQDLKEAQAAAPQSVDAAVSLAQFYLWRGQLVEAEAAFQNALRISSGDANALLGLATVEKRLGKNEETEQVYRKLEGLPDKRYQHLHAAYLFSGGRREEGLRELEKLAKKSPVDRGSRNRLVAAYLVTGRIAAAENVLDVALKANPHDADALFQRSQIRLRSGKTEEAESDLNQVLHFHPDSAEAHYLLAQIHESRGDRARQIAELNEALHYNQALLPGRVALAQLLALSGSPSAALEMLNSAPKEQSQSLILVLERNLAYYASGNQQGFREGVAQALRLGRVPDTLLQDVVVKLADRDYVGARASADEALKQNPDNIRALRAKAFSYTAQNQPKEASRFLIDYVEQAKSAAVGQFVGQWLWLEGNHAQARAAWTRAKLLDPQYVPTDLALAQADLAEARISDARATLSKVVAADAGNFPGHVLLAVTESRANNFDLAIAHYREALQLQPHNGEVLNNLAYLLADKANRMDEALVYAQQAVEAMPGNPDAAGTLGWIFYRQGLYQEAQRQLQRAAAQDRHSIDPNAVIRRYHLAMVCSKLGDYQKASELLAQALQQNPNLPEAAIALAAVR
jgi:tetratricopeptide (TPR) repeat protein